MGLISRVSSRTYRKNIKMTDMNTKKYNLLQSIHLRDQERKAKLFNKSQTSVYDQILKRVNLITSSYDFDKIESELKERQKDLSTGEFSNLTARLDRFRERIARMERYKGKDTRI